MVFNLIIFLYFCSIKFEILKTDYFFEEGHCLEDEDLVQYIIWKIDDLRNKGYLKKDIINFTDSQDWQYISCLILNHENEPY